MDYRDAGGLPATIQHDFDPTFLQGPVRGLVRSHGFAYRHARIVLSVSRLYVYTFVTPAGTYTKTTRRT